MHSHFSSLMIILIVYIKGIAVLNLESNAPVPTDIYRPSSFTITFKWMQSQTRQVHIFKIFSSFKKSKNLSNPSYMLGIDTTRDSRFEQPLKPFMFEFLNHTSLV